MGELKKLIEEKKEIEEKIKLIKQKKKLTNGKSELIKVSGIFNNHIEEIISRIRKVDPDKKIFKTTITSTIVKHDDWPKMKENIINHISKPGEEKC